MNDDESEKVYNAKSFSLNAIDATIRLYSTSDSLKPYYLQQHKVASGKFHIIFLRIHKISVILTLKNEC